MKFIPSWMGRSVVSTVLLIFLLIGAAAYAVDPTLSNSFILIKSPNTVSPPQAGIGRMAYYPMDKMFAKPEYMRLNFELHNPDGMSRLNILTLGIEGYIVRNEDVEQYWNNTGILQNFASEGAVYTDESTSPAINNGMLVCPYGADGNIVSALVGTPIKVTSPYIMNGSFKVHSNPNINVYKVKVIDMPFKFTQAVKDIMLEAQYWNPDEPLSLSVDIFANINYALNVQNGCAKYLGFYETRSKCIVHFDGRLVPSKGIQHPMVNQSTIDVPAGCLSWLDLYESDGLSPWRKVDLKDCNFQMASSRAAEPPPMDRLKISGLNNPEARKFFKLFTRN